MRASRGFRSGPGRGSSAGSLVAYSLKITDVDPLHFDLYFERFLNPERVSLPDIDVDFCERRRGEVITYVTEKYGRENVAQIITFGTMKAKAAVRDVGRVMEMPISDVDRVAKLIPSQLDMTLDLALEEAPALADLDKNDPRVHELLEVARRLEGMTRHASVHAAGVVIAPKPLTEFVPLYRSQKDDGEITTQWAMKEIERVGLLKMDFLGLSTLTLLDDAVKHIKETTGDDIDLDGAPARRREELPDLPERPDARRVPVRELGHARHAAQGQAAVPRGPDRAQRAVSAGAAARRRRRRLHRAQARPRRGQVRPAADGARPQGDVRRHRVSGAGHAAGERAGRVHAGPGRRAAARDGQEGRGEDAGAARRVHRAAAARGHPREEGRQDLRVHRVLRRLRLQQGALDDLRAARVSDRVSQGELPAPFHGGAADDRVAELRQGRAVPGRVPRARRAGAAAGHQRQPLAVRRRAGRRAVRPGRGEGRRRGRDSVDPGARDRRSAAASRRSSSWPSTSTCGS